MAPEGSDVVPEGSGVVPEGSGMAPEGSGVVPEGSGVVPEGWGEPLVISMDCFGVAIPPVKCEVIESFSALLSSGTSRNVNDFRALSPQFSCYNISSNAFRFSFSLLVRKKSFIFVICLVEMLISRFMLQTGMHQCKWVRVSQLPPVCWSCHSFLLGDKSWCSTPNPLINGGDVY